MHTCGTPGCVDESRHPCWATNTLLLLLPLLMMTIPMMELMRACSPCLLVHCLPYRRSSSLLVPTLPWLQAQVHCCSCVLRAAACCLRQAADPGITTAHDTSHETAAGIVNARQSDTHQLCKGVRDGLCVSRLQPAYSLHSSQQVFLVSTEAVAGGDGTGRAFQTVDVT